MKPGKNGDYGSFTILYLFIVNFISCVSRYKFQNSKIISITQDTNMDKSNPTIVTGLLRNVCFN
jgi:hypothetical protein